MILKQIGQNQPPRHGDFEAQRHWMELTLNLNTFHWYRQTQFNDLDYWGLDYPPLTAYLSQIHGFLYDFKNFFLFSKKNLKY